MQFKRIVVGIDFSANSLAAARWSAKQFAPDAELVIVNVVPESDASLSTRRHIPRTIDDLRVSTPHLQGGLRGLGNLLGADRTRTETLSGDPAEVLALAAALVRADLVCVGSGSHRRGSARFGATTPHRLIARADVPVLITPSVSLAAPSRILVPFDDRASRKTVLETAARLATAYEAALDALYVIETDMRRPVSTNPEVQGIVSFFRAQRAAAVLIDGLDLPEGRAASFVRPGDAGEQIVSHARRANSNLIVMGTGERAAALRGDRYARHVGSTTRFVIWAAPCSVLVIPPGTVTACQRARPARALGSPMAELERSSSLAEV
jgi:nucleotide-binding universal stress UspA family protein